MDLPITLELIKDEEYPELICDESIAHIFKHTPTSANGRIDISHVPYNPNFASSFARGKEAVLHGLTANCSDASFDLNTKYGRVASITNGLAGNLPANIRDSLSKTATHYWYPHLSETPLPLDIACPAGLIKRSGQSHVYMNNSQEASKSVVKVLRPRAFKNASVEDLLQIINGFLYERSLYLQLFSDIEIDFPEEKYFILNDPRTGFPTVGISQAYVEGLVDIFSFDAKAFSTLPFGTACIKLFTRVLSIGDLYSVYPDITGKCNFCVSAENKITNIDPHIFMRKGFHPDVDRDIEIKLAYMREAINSFIQSEFQRF